MGVVTRRAGLVWLIAALGPTLAGCQRLSDADAVSLVRTYNARKIEAYRSSDPRLVDPVTSVREGQKILGLVGVKLDMGIALDAEILDFRVLGVERTRSRVTVSTEERWHYLDRKIGSGERVGQESTDHYRMRYQLVRDGDRWVVDAIEFASEPEVGRTEFPIGGSPRAMHGMPPDDPERAGAGEKERRP